jgi:hypothetical protein
MDVHQILSAVKKCKMVETAIAKRLLHSPPHPLLGELVFSETREKGRVVSYDVLMPGSVTTAVEEAADRNIPRPEFKMRRFFPDKTSAANPPSGAAYGVDMSREAIVWLVSASNSGSDRDKIKAQMQSALDTVENSDRLDDRPFAIQTHKGSVVAVGRRYGEAYVHRYTARAEEERTPLERSRPGEDSEERRARIREKSAAFVEEERDQARQARPHKRRDQDQL